MGPGDGNPLGPQASRRCGTRAPSQGTCLGSSRMKTSSLPGQNGPHLESGDDGALSPSSAHSTLWPAPQGSLKPEPPSPLHRHPPQWCLWSPGPLLAQPGPCVLSALRARHPGVQGHRGRWRRAKKSKSVSDTVPGAAGAMGRSAPGTATGSHCRALNHRHLTRSLWDTFHN